MAAAEREQEGEEVQVEGIDTERPILQVDRYVFTGEYEDTLGTCVVFEENKDHDAEGNQKLQLKYKCHTMKKLKMTRTLLTEKKEGEENTGGGVEWLELKDKDFSYSRPNMICNFLYEKEESKGKLVEESEGEAGDPENSIQNSEPEMNHVEMDDPVPLLDAVGSDGTNSSMNSHEDIAVEDSPP
ncbi:general transcription factor 3C polypeptide 6 isoform X5 [Sceloporus undulatus]|uniref:general transcription factor 3C polypeptide 6 isoform X5 n=1 Tax=Sceloporus undulatus TaxID=8520 RepID=UPI001C4C1A4F|nr:general transcription factor 3C polypeptide 6 isoform X5 [Sceloporus undulatus]